jgi:hypothetical protein
MKTTSNGRWPQNIKRWISRQPLLGSSSNFKLKLRGPTTIKNNWNDDPPMERLWIGSSSNFKPKFRGSNLTQNWLKWHPPMEDDLKLLKGEYLSNHWLDLPQISYLSSGDQPKSKMIEMMTPSNWRRPQNWISKQPLIGSSLPQISNLSSGDQPKSKMIEMMTLQWKTTSEYQNI